MAGSSTGSEQIDAVVAARDLGNNPTEDKLIERRKSEGDSIYKVVRRRKSRSLTEVELQQQFEPFTRDIRHVPSGASSEERNNEDNLVLEGNREPPSPYEKRLYIMITILGVIVMLLLSVVSYLFARREAEHDLIPIPVADVPRNSTVYIKPTTSSFWKS